MADSSIKGSEHTELIIVVLISQLEDRQYRDDATRFLSEVLQRKHIKPEGLVDYVERTLGETNYASGVFIGGVWYPRPLSLSKLTMSDEEIDGPQTVNSDDLGDDPDTEVRFERADRNRTDFVTRTFYRGPDDPENKPSSLYWGLYRCLMSVLLARHRFEWLQFRMELAEQRRGPDKTVPDPGTVIS
ncbi:MAG: hypothetical protein AAGI89_09945 [Pseudomonadota bacterium]